MSSEQLVIGGALAEQLMLFTTELHNGHTRLKDKLDSLIWSQNRPYGRRSYSTKWGYQMLMTIEVPVYATSTSRKWKDCGLGSRAVS